MFIRSTLILVLGGFITKILGMFIRIITTRSIGIEGMSIYMLIIPTFSLFMTLSQVSLPNAISKLVSEDKYNNKNIMFSSIPFLILVNLLLIILLIFVSKPIAIYLLKDERCYLPILAISLVLPFDSLSNMFRGYFFGKQKMFPHIISHIVEQIARLTLIIIFIPKLIEIDIIYGVTFLILVNMISEIISIFILFLFLPKNFKLKRKDVIPNLNNLNLLLKIAIPSTASKVIGNIGYFLEPILLTSACFINGVPQKFIQNEYATVSGYVLPLLLFIGFFSNAISSALLPNLTKLYDSNKKLEIKKKLVLACLISLSLGIILTLIFIIQPSFLLKLFYHTTLGSSYLRFMAPFFLLYYIEGPLQVTLIAINKSKNIMIDNLIGTIIKSLIIFILPFLGLNIYALIIGIISNLLIVTSRHYLTIKKYLVS